MYGETLEKDLDAEFTDSAIESADVEIFAKLVRHSDTGEERDEKGDTRDCTNELT